MSSSKDKYELRGVSASKFEVHAAIENLDKGLFPNAFCKIIPDVVAGDPEWCNIMHADTAGTKTSLAYVYWRETGDLSVWKGIVQDAIVMNLDDMAVVGCFQDILLSNTIGRNKNLVTGEVIKTVIQGTVDFVDNMKEQGINLHLTGGETADVGDIVRTVDIGFTAFARMKREDVLSVDIQAGDVVIGFASYGQSTYESEYNGGMGSNGLTSARHDILAAKYRDKYPESYDPATPKDLVYSGSRSLDEVVTVEGNEIPLGKLILSPTRTFMPLIKSMFDKYRSALHGLIHCTGGGTTKVLKFVEGVKIIKDNPLPIPPLFQLIHQESGTSLREMYQVFNMGCRLEAYVPAQFAEEIIALSTTFGIHAQVMGRVESGTGKEVELHTSAGIFEYSE
ncbi:MAG: AIR synthase related protein [Saprospiraceae bacterium]